MTVDRGFIDVAACFGPSHGTAGTADAALDLLVAERRSHGIRLSLAHSLTAIWTDSGTGNRSAFEAAGDPANGIAAIAVVGPRRTGDVARRIEEAARSGAVGFLLVGWVGDAPPSDAVREVLDAVGRSGRPLLVSLPSLGPHAGTGDASVIGAATAHLGIPVVLLGAHYGHVVHDLAAAVRHPHLHLETSALAHFRAVETAVKAIGAERILLGTGSPRRAAASPVEAVLAASLGDAEKRAILAENAARLFGLPPGPVDLTPSPVPQRAFDVHAHLGPLDLDVPDVPHAALLSVLDVPPAQAAVASSAMAIFGDPERGNAEAVRAAAAGHGSGTYAYVVADPTDLAFTEAQLARHLGASGVLGVKVHAEWSRTPTASRAMADLFDLLARFGRPVKIHNAGPDWETALGAYSRRHPRLPIIVAHGGPGTPGVEAARLAATMENVHVELSSSFADLATVREVVAIAGPDRLLWGSDAPLLEPAFVLGTYLDAGIAAGDIDRVFWGNAAALFGR